MSEVLTPPDEATEPGYKTVDATVDGVPMSWKFYEGFVSRIWYRSPGSGTEQTIWEQSECFHCQPDGPKARSKMWIKGGPDQVDIELEIDDAPIDKSSDYRGPIEAIALDLRKEKGTPAPADKRVKPVKGGDKIAKIKVKRRKGWENEETGGVEAFQGGGSTGADNSADTCPPHCKL